MRKKIEQKDSSFFGLEEMFALTDSEKFICVERPMSISCLAAVGESGLFEPTALGMTCAFFENLAPAAALTNAPNHVVWSRRVVCARAVASFLFKGGVLKKQGTRRDGDCGHP